MTHIKLPYGKYKNNKQIKYVKPVFIFCGYAKSV